jgi:hypothetical protein
VVVGGLALEGQSLGRTGVLAFVGWSIPQVQISQTHLWWCFSGLKEDGFFDGVCINKANKFIMECRNGKVMIIARYSSSTASACCSWRAA